LAQETLTECYPRFGEEPDGVTPFQQRLAIKLMKKVEENMEGWYPALTRVLLATVGPYQQNALQPNPTAFNLLRNAFYSKLSRLPELATMKPDKLQDYMPENLAFDRESATLTHTYRFGSQAITALPVPEAGAVDFYDAGIRRRLTAEERNAAVWQFQNRPLRSISLNDLETLTRFPYRPDSPAAQGLP
jgi:hypothetical protein